MKEVGYGQSKRGGNPTRKGRGGERRRRNARIFVSSCISCRRK